MTARIISIAQRQARDACEAIAKAQSSSDCSYTTFKAAHEGYRRLDQLSQQDAPTRALVDAEVSAALAGERAWMLRAEPELDNVNVTVANRFLVHAENLWLDVRDAWRAHFDFSFCIRPNLAGLLFVKVPTTNLSAALEWRPESVGWSVERLPGSLHVWCGRLDAVFCSRSDRGNARAA